jgi:hypothetical protein
MIIPAETPIYFDDGLGSSAHVFLRTSDDRFLLLTFSILETVCILSCSKDNVMLYSSFLVHTKPEINKIRLTDASIYFE